MCARNAHANDSVWGLVDRLCAALFARIKMLLLTACHPIFTYKSYCTYDMTCTNVLISQQYVMCNTRDVLGTNRCILHHEHHLCAGLQCNASYATHTMCLDAHSKSWCNNPSGWSITFAPFKMIFRAIWASHTSVALKASSNLHSNHQKVSKNFMKILKQRSYRNKKYWVFRIAQKLDNTQFHLLMLIFSKINWWHSIFDKSRTDQNKNWLYNLVT